jgi:hypothetical protein
MGEENWASGTRFTPYGMEKAYCKGYAKKNGEILSKSLKNVVKA